ncbi:streptamidine family RiPP [Actinokineospora sp. G85]|nr:streptamidine family RiPP [Actinokineospora pegani]
MDNVFVHVEEERLLPHNSASHSNALVENPFDGDDE